MKTSITFMDCKVVYNYQNFLLMGRNYVNQTIDVDLKYC